MKQHEDKRVVEARRATIARTFVEAVPFLRTSHFDPHQPFSKTGGISNEARERFESSAQLNILPKNPLLAYVSGQDTRTVVPLSGDITKACAFIATDFVTSKKADAKRIYGALTNSFGMSSTEYYTGESAELVAATAGSLATLLKVSFADKRVIREYCTEVITPVSRLARIATAFAAILNARQLHNQFDISGPVNTQLFAALSTRLNRGDQGAAWISALFKDILDPAINPSCRPQQHRAALFCAHLLLNSFRKINFNIDPTTAHEVVCAIRDAILLLPEKFATSDYSALVGKDIRLARWQELDRANELCQQREAYFQSLRRD